MFIDAAVQAAASDINAILGNQWWQRLVKAAFQNGQSLSLCGQAVLQVTQAFTKKAQAVWAQGGELIAAGSSLVRVQTIDEQQLINLPSKLLKRWMIMQSQIMGENKKAPAHGGPSLANVFVI